MAKLGYQFDPDDLSDVEIDAFMLIESEFDRQQADEMKRASKGRGRRG